MVVSWVNAGPGREFGDEGGYPGRRLPGTRSRTETRELTLESGLPTVSPVSIERRILFARGQRVMLSTDLAHLYEVEPRALVQAVKRNTERFPTDFMFQLTDAEFANLKSQFVTSSWGGMRRALPYAFTEQGVAMLSSVLRSRRAVLVNVEIMRAFVRLRRILAAHADLARKLEELERKYDVQFKVVFDAIRGLMQPSEPEKARRQIGFHVSDGKPKYEYGRPSRSRRLPAKHENR